MDGRREFLKALAAGAGGCLLGDVGGAEPPAAAALDLNSVFARTRAPGCAQKMMVAGLEYLDEPPELRSVAALFNGGMGIGGPCGYFCAGLMLIGLATAGGADGSAAIKARQAYADAWKQKWPFTCPEIRAAQAAEEIKASCGEIGTEAATLLAPILAPLAADPHRARFARRAGA